MKKLFILLVAVSAGFVSCSDDDDATLPDNGVDFSITGINPASGPVGTEVTVTGTGFPSNAEELTVSFDGNIATITSITSTELVLTVPEGADTGDVVVTYNSETTSAGVFNVSEAIVTGTASNLFAPQTGGQGQPVGGPFTKFDFETGAETDSETDWDIAFRGTTIAVNGGVVTGTADEPARTGDAAAAIATGIFADVVTAEDLEFEQDADGAYAIPSGSDNGWYNYSGPPNFLITPIPGKILVFRTRNGNLAKIEILSYYENAPTNPDGMVDASRYYTFNYVYNPNEGDTSLE